MEVTRINFLCVFLKRKIPLTSLLLGKNVGGEGY